MLNQQLLEIGKKIKAISETGLIYQKDPYDVERYEELKQLGIEILSLTINEPIESINSILPQAKQYPTPNVDVRAVVLNDAKEILLVKEVVDGKWSLPGGWADIGYTPAEVAVKETREESGYEVSAHRLLAVMDKRKHPHPPDVHYVHKIYLECRIIGSAFEAGHETQDVQFWNIGALPDLSLPRNTEGQLQILHDLCLHPDKPAYFD